jgi:glycosyltransferase involved in cell wall biosynthesis
MKLLFVCDHVFLKYKDVIFSDKFSYHILNRYLKISDSITVVARVKEVNEIGGTLVASGNNVSFRFLNSISSIKSFLGQRRKVESIFKSLYLTHSLLIARLPSEFGFIACKIANKRKVKYAIEVVGCGWEAYWYYGGYRAKLYAVFVYLKMKNIIRQSKNSIYVTKYFLQKRYPSSLGARVTNISNVELLGLDKSCLEIRSKKIKTKENNKFIFGTIGSLKTNYKGVQLALKAFSEIDFEFEYRILGEGPYLDVYKKQAAELGVLESVIFDGVLARRADVFRWLDDIDVYLQPSLTEGLPRALIEAMSRGCPSIGSRAGGIPELLNKKFIFKTNNYKELKRKIEYIVSDESILLSCSVENFEKSKHYEKSYLENKRTDFFSNLK